jgi:hypothetical protein
MKCHKCGSERIELGISWGLSAETGNLGLKYKKGILHQVTQVYSDLCLDCGSIVKMYIKDTTDRNWVKKPGSFGSI